MSRITAVIFDMYDTLVQNEQHFWQATFEEIVREQDLDTTADRLWAEWRTVEKEFRLSRIKPGVAFKSYYQAWRESFANAFTVLQLKGDAVAAAHQAVQDISRRPPFPETLEALGLIQPRWQTGILSNADDDFLHPNVARLGLRFAAVVSSETAGCYKPQPDLFREMLSRLGASPQEAVYVGDRQFEDVTGASQVGMRAVWVNRLGAPLDPALPAPDYQVSNLLQLPPLLDHSVTEERGVQRG
jgi:putative hydrolase of the HAD superfamily